MSEWFNQNGPSGDVIVSSRVRLSRNLSGHLFPGSMGHEEEEQIKNTLLKAFQDLEDAGDFQAMQMESLRPNERRMLLEKKLISQDFSTHKEKTLILNGDLSFSGMINGEDHLRMVRLGSGFSLDDLIKDMMKIDSRLEELVGFAADIDWGYLSSDLNNLGTGMKTSVLVHLPALAKTGLIDKALKAMLQADFQVTGFFGDSPESLGQFYLVANNRTLGMSEEENRSQLEKLAEQLISYERIARQDLMNNRLELEDLVFRAKGLLENCRLLTYNESVELISSLRLGSILEMLDFDLKTLNALLILGQPSHIQERLIAKEIKIEERAADKERADFFKERLFPEGNGLFSERKE